MKYLLLLTEILVLTTVLLAAKSADAQEVRTYLQVDVGVYHLDEAPISLKLAPFVKVEDRFRDQGLVLNKTFVGMKLRILSWLSTQFYYAHKDLLYSAHQQKHMTVGDLILTYDDKQIRLSDRIGNEWHVTDRFYRLRNYTELLYKTPLKWLGLWAAEEFRFDSDQERINMNDVRAGFQFSPLDKWLPLKIGSNFMVSNRLFDILNTDHQPPFRKAPLHVKPRTFRPSFPPEENRPQRRPVAQA
jgi:hypothetical protein